MFLFLPKWVSLEYKTVVGFQDSKKNLHNVAVAANNCYDSLSFSMQTQKVAAELWAVFLK